MVKTVAELIEELKKLPPDAKVMKSNNEGCCECNPEGFPSYRDIYYVQFMEIGEYPYLDEKNIVVI